MISGDLEMDYTGLAIVVGIIIYGIFEYLRREKLHNQVMEYLERDMRPPEVIPKPEVWKLVTTGSTGVLLLGMTVLFAGLAVHHGRLNPITLLIALVFAALFLLIYGMFMRDLRRYRQYSKPAGEVKP